MLLLSAYGINASASDIKLPKGFMVAHFIYLDLRNAVVPLTTLSASHDGRACANDVT